MLRWLQDLYYYYLLAHHIPRSPLQMLRLLEMGVLLRHQKRESLDEFLEKAQTGDILVMVSDNFYSWLQMFFTDSYASHVAMVYRDEDDHVYIYESTLKEKGIVDVITGREKDGPMLVDARHRITDAYDKGQLAIRVRHLELPPGITHDMLGRTMRKFMRRHRKNGFDSNPVRLINGASAHWLPFASWLGLDRPDPHKIFCSQMAARLYMKMGLMHKDREAGEYSPSDWTEHGHNLLLQDGVKLYPERALWIKD